MFFPIILSIVNIAGCTFFFFLGFMLGKSKEQKASRIRTFETSANTVYIGTAGAMEKYTVPDRRVIDCHISGDEVIFIFPIMGSTPIWRADGIGGYTIFRNEMFQDAIGQHLQRVIVRLNGWQGLIIFYNDDPGSKGQFLRFNIIVQN